MGNHHRLCLFGQGLFQLCCIDVILRDGHIHEHRHRAVLDSRSHCGWKPAGNRDDFIPPLYPALTQQRGGQRHKGRQIGGGTGIHQGAETHSQIACQLLLKFIGVPAGGKPELQRTVHQVYHLLMVINPGSIGDAVSLLKGPLFVVVGVAVFGYHVQNLLPCLCLCLMFKCHVHFSSLRKKFCYLPVHNLQHILAVQISPGPLYRLLDGFLHPISGAPAKY